MRQAHAPYAFPDGISLSANSTNPNLTSQWGVRRPVWPPLFRRQSKSRTSQRPCPRFPNFAGVYLEAGLFILNFFCAQIAPFFSGWARGVKIVGVGGCLAFPRLRGLGKLERVDFKAWGLGDKLGNPAFGRPHRGDVREGGACRKFSASCGIGISRIKKGRCECQRRRRDSFKA